MRSRAFPPAFVLAVGTALQPESFAAGGRVLPLDPAVPFFGAKFEPHGIYHIAQGETSSAVVWDCAAPGAACDIGTIKKYAAASAQAPIGVMQYITLEDWSPGASLKYGRLGADIRRTFKDKKRIPQIGTGFWPSGDNQFDDTAAAAAGAYDGFWKALAKLVKGSKEPVFIRPGYEFGGSGAGSFYDATDYKAAFRRMVELFRAEGVMNVAFVWDHYNEPAYMTYYPGDEYVDWWGINLFHNGDFGSPLTAAFLADALAHRKPVLVCESSPKDQPVTDSGAWSGFYAPFFDFPARYPQVKGLSYINSSWEGWEGFEEARIELDPLVVRPQFAAAIAHPAILHHADDGGAGVLFGPAIDIRPGASPEAAVVGPSGAIVTWKTIPLVKKQTGRTTSRVEYGPTAAYGSSTPEDPAFTTDHSVTLSGLAPGTLYHFRVHGFDEAGFEIRSGDFVFTTSPFDSLRSLRTTDYAGMRRNQSPCAPADCSE